MKNIFKTISGALAGIMLFTASISSLAAAPTISINGNNIEISGCAELSDGDRNVTLRVLKPGKTTADAAVANNPLDVFAYLTQTKTDAAGNYTFNAELDEPGKYSAIVISDGGKYTESAQADLPAAAEITTDKIGNIFSDYSNIEYKCSVPNAGNELCDVTVEVINTSDNSTLKTINKTLKAENNEIKDAIDLSDANVHYGIFKLKLTLDCDCVSASGETTFSVMNAASRLNQKMSVQTHFGAGRWDSVTSNESCHYNNVDEVGKISELFANAGFGRIRDELRWQFYSKNTSDYADWNSKLLYDKNTGNIDLWNGDRTYLEAVRDNNIDELLILGFGCKYTDHKIPDSIEELEYFKDYCMQAAAATKQYGIKNFEVYNEYNWSGADKDSSDGITPNPYTPEMYVDMIKAASDGAREGNPDAKIYAGGFAYVITPEDADFWDWTDKVLKLLKAEDEKRDDGKSYIDGWTYHIYRSGNQPENSKIPYVTGTVLGYQIKNYYTTMGDLADAVKAKLNEYGYGDIPLVVSETGHSSKAEYDETYPGGAEIMQANYELRDFALMYDKTDYVSFYNAVSKQNSDSEYERKLGLVNSYLSDSYNDSGVAYSAKPVFLAMANFNSLLANAELKNKTITGNNYDFEFKNQDEQTVHMLWCKEGSGNYTLSDEPIALYDMYGNSLNTDGTSVTLGESPIYAVTAEGWKFNFTDENGQALTKLKTGEVNISLSKMKNTGETVILAVYDNNRLVNVETHTVAEISQGYCINIDENIDRLALFVWEDLNTIKPVTGISELTR